MRRRAIIYTPEKHEKKSHHQTHCRVYVGSSCTLESSLATRKENKKYIAHKDTHNFAFVPSGGRGIIEKHYTHNIITKKRGRQKRKKN